MVRSSTENIAGIVGFAKAAEFAISDLTLKLKNEAFKDKLIKSERKH